MMHDAGPHCGFVPAFVLLADVVLLGRVARSASSDRRNRDGALLRVHKASTRRIRIDWQLASVART